MERSGLTLKKNCLKILSNRRAKKKFFFADFALQNMVETTLPDGLEASGQRAYRFHFRKKYLNVCRTSQNCTGIILLELSSEGLTDVHVRIF